MTDEILPDERLLVLVAYGLFLIAPPFGGFSGLIAVIIAHVRSSHVAGTIFESHYRNQIQVFWTMLVIAILMLGTMSFALGLSFFTLIWPFGWSFDWPWHVAMLGLGWAMLAPAAVLLSLVLVVWYYWRMISGFVRMLDDKPY